MNQITPKQLIEMMALLDKMKIQCNDQLNPIEKELLKQLIDEIKRTAGC